VCKKHCQGRSFFKAKQPFENSLPRAGPKPVFKRKFFPPPPFFFLFFLFPGKIYFILCDYKTNITSN